MNTTRSARAVPDLESSQLSVLRLLDASPHRSQREVARELGMSVGRVNYLLQALLGMGFVKVQNFTNASNRRSYAYLLTQKGITAKVRLTRRFLKSKIHEYDRLRTEIENLRAESLRDNARPIGRRSGARGELTHH